MNLNVNSLKNILYPTILFFLKISVLQAQTATLDWLKQAGDPKSFELFSSAQTYDTSGNLYISGLVYVDSFVVGNFTLVDSNTPWEFIVKYDTGGNVMWAKEISGPGTSVYDWGLAVNKDGSFFINGTVQSDTLNLGGLIVPIGNYQTHFFVAKADNNGNFLWAKFAGGARSQGGGASTDNDGNVYVTGIFPVDTIQLSNFSFSNPFGGSSFFVAKYDPNGNIVWARPGYQRGSGISCYLIMCDSAGNLFISGGFEGNSLTLSTTTLLGAYPSETSFLARYDSNGNLVWAKTVGKDESNGPNSIAMDIGGNIFLSGIFYGRQLIIGNDTLNEFDQTGNNADAFVAKFDNNGNPLWARNTQAFSPNDGVFVTAIYDNRVTVVGTFYSDSIGFGNIKLANTDSGNFNFFVVQYDANGGPLWAKIDGKNNSYGAGVFEDKMRNIYVFGNYGPNTLVIDSDSLSGSGDGIFFLAKITPFAQFANLGNDTTVCTGSAVQLGGSPTAQGGVAPYSYQWSPTTGLSCDTCANPIATVTSHITYFVTVTDSTGASSVGSIDVQAHPFVTPSTTIYASYNNICTGFIETFNNAPTNEGNAPVYIWKMNGSVVDSNSVSYITDSLKSGDSIQCILLSSAACLTTDTAVSNTVSVIVNPVYNISIADTICAGDTVFIGTTGYVAAGNYRNTLFSTGGCDSIVNLSLTVKPAPVVTLSWDSMIAEGYFGPRSQNINDTTAGYCPHLQPPIVFLLGGSPPGGFYTGRWVRNDTLFGDSISYSSQYITLDTITYTYTNAQNCIGRATDSVYVEVCEAINSITGLAGISLYPNPASGLIYIQTEGIQAQAIQIYDVSGQLVSAMRFAPQVDVSALAQGVYLIEVTAPEGTARRQFVKM